MIAYFVLFAGTAFLALIAHRLRSRQTVRALFVGVLLVFWLFVGLRDEVGCDWARYQVLFDLFSTQGLGSIGRIDLGYVLVNKAVAVLGGSFFWVNLCFAALLVGSIGVFLWDEPEPFMGLAVLVPVFVMITGMSATRQAAAVSLIFLAMSMFLRSRYRALATAGLGVLFHPSAVAALPMGVLMARRGKRRLGFTVLLIATVLGLLVLLSTLNVVSRYVVLYGEGGLESGGGVFRTGIVALFGTFVLMFGRTWRRLYADYDIWKWFAYGSLVLFLFSFINSVVADRLSLYLMPMNAIVACRLPRLIRNSRSRGFQPFVRAPMLLLHFAVLYVLLAVAELRWCWVPYQWVL